MFWYIKIKIGFRMLYSVSLISFLLWRTSLAATEEEAKSFLEQYNKENADWTYKVTVAEWNYASNITDENLKNKLIISSEYAKFVKNKWTEVTSYPWATFKDPDVRRQFKKLSVLGLAALPEDKYDKLQKTIAEMESIYSTAKVCDYNNSTKCDLSLEPELTKIMATSRNESELKHVWTEWRKKTGKPIRSLYKEYVDLLNEASKMNNFTNAAEYWLSNYETNNITDQFSELWNQLRPFYLEVHAYMRRKLREKYGENIVPKRGPIPAHLLGNMWAQTWSNVADLANPFTNAKVEDVTKYLMDQNYTAEKVFRSAEEFFLSLNLSAMPEEFWKYSILEKPADRELVCHASAWDFYNGKDFRIKQCTEITGEDFTTAHHEMGHVEYYMQYSDQPYVYREGANEGFHEAIGDVIALSVNTPKHLNKIGLLPSVSTNTEDDLNHLFDVALNKIVFLPFGYLMDLWRWNVFKGITNEKNYNCYWWKLRLELQGVSPPNERTEEDFDPAAKYHTVSGTPYIRYFVSFVIQFQFHEALCRKAGEYDPSNPSAKPLHQCDIYKSTEAGNLLKEALKLGSSKPWPEVMKILTGQPNMDASSLIRYFEPIYQWLKDDNKKNAEFVGWEIPKRVCSSKKYNISRFLKKVANKVRNIFGNDKGKA